MVTLVKLMTMDKMAQRLNDFVVSREDINEMCDNAKHRATIDMLVMVLSDLEYTPENEKLRSKLEAKKESLNEFINRR